VGTVGIGQACKESEKMRTGVACRRHVIGVFGGVGDGGGGGAQWVQTSEVKCGEVYIGISNMGSGGNGGGVDDVDDVDDGGVGGDEGPDSRLQSDLCTLSLYWTVNYCVNRVYVTTPYVHVR
jgi:hypothetical protein